MTSLEPAEGPDPATVPPPDDAPLTVTLRTPEDLLAMVPTSFGFVPEQSLVMVSLRADRPDHARVDLPGDREHLSDLPEVVAALHEPLGPHGVAEVALVAYTGDHRLAHRTCRATARSWARHGVTVPLCLRAEPDRWFPVDLGEPPGPERAGEVPPGTPYDVSTHPLVTRAVLDGRVVLRTRAELAASLQPDPAAVAPVAARLRALEHRTGDSRAVRVDRVSAVVQRHLAGESLPGSAELALLLDDLRDEAARDSVWQSMHRGTAPGHVRLWTGVVRASPGPLAAAPAVLLAFAAWLSGHGALAWCALDRCAEGDPHLRPAALLGRLLRSAVPPDAWEPRHPGGSSG